MKKLMLIFVMSAALTAPHEVPCECHTTHEKGEVCDCEVCKECELCLPVISPYCDSDYHPCP